MWHLQFCFLIMVGSFCAVVVVLCLKDTPCPRQPPSPPFHPETRLYLWVSCTPLISLHGSSREGSQPSLFLPPAPPESTRLCAFQQRLVTGWWESWGQLSWLMDDLSDFIWAGRTLRWLRPSDCQFWLLYRGLTYRAVILLEWGSQALQTFPPPGTASPNGGQIGQQTGLILNKYHCQPVSFLRVPSEKAMLELVMWPQQSSFLWWAFGEPEVGPSEPGASCTLPCLLWDKAAFMQLSGGEVIQCVSTNHKCAAGVNFIWYYK